MNKLNLSPKSQKTLETLEAKADMLSGNKMRMPSIKSIHELLAEVGIQHYYDAESVNQIESRSGSNTYVNDRRDGKVGKKIEIKNPYLRLDSSDSYYSWNTDIYARELVKMVSQQLGD